ncbi:MAG TPA: hypothetical protein VG013_22680 [Gemmataceae bacterium]|jgi:hypothetical protein|nr:hypothetical protein [Gemmataceae bacterium]
MLRALYLAMTILVLPLGRASADARPDLGANAALKYWQALATLPKFTNAEQKKLGESLTRPLDAQARELVTKAEYALRMMHRGAALPRCDWGLPPEEGLYVRLPHVDGARVLSSLACLRARMRFEEGHSAEAVDDIVAALTLGRHTSRDAVLIMTLAGYAIERPLSETLARYLPKLNDEMLKDLKRRLEALPPGGTPATGMRYEEKFWLDWFVRSVKEAKDKESLLALLALASLDSEGKGRDPQENARAFLKECGGTADGVLKCAEETRSCYARVTKKLELPLNQFEKEFEREARKQAGNPVFQVFFPAIVNVRRAQARADVRRALLSAALAVQLDGRDALKKHPDPVVGGPFAYVAFEGGFELRSKLKGNDDKPVSLTVGRRGN